jgi:hypothetical protein
MNEFVSVLTLLLKNSVIANFEYWSEFVLRIQRDDANRHHALQEMFGSMRVPSLFCIRLRGTWWIGQHSEWDRDVESFPLKGVSPVALEAPMQAAVLVTKLGKEISTVKVGENGDLTLDISDGSSMFVQGTGGGWNESWFLELPADDPDRDKWKIVCESQGIIGGTIPSSRN